MHYLLDENGRREWTRHLQHDFITLFRDALREHPADLPKMLEFITNPCFPSTSPRCLPPAATGYSWTQAPPTPGS
jgi:hypothetical protein